ncbi:MAG: prefoldin subunit alpha [Euryarchaeota archaeon]|nr:prefoldin subunit alpha [Euryarchaeota archaeon]
MTPPRAVTVRGVDLTDPTELQRIARLVDMNRQHLNSLGDQIDKLSHARNEHSEVIHSLKSLSENTSEKMMIPLGSGAQLTVDNPQNPGVVLDIGSGIQAERELPEAISILENRLADIDGLNQKLQAEFNSIEAKVKELAKKFTDSADSSSQENDYDEEISEDTTNEPEIKVNKPKRSRRGFSGELTLDD